jgi:hypothetical protein
VLDLPEELSRPILVSRPLLLPLVREEAVAAVGRVATGIATSGDLLKWHPHLHVLVSDGGFSADGVFRPLQVWDGQEIMRLFRARLLARLVERRAISHELATRLLGWRHPGFSAHVGEPIAAGDTHSLEDMAGYVVRNPLSLKRLVYLDGQQAVIYRALKPNPSLGQNFMAMDPLEWLARMTDHIPNPRRHRTLFYGRYANRARGARQKEKALLETAQAEVPKRRRCPPSWARLISKVYHADPLKCRECGGPLKIVAYLHDQAAIRSILDHLGLTPPESERPPYGCRSRAPRDARPGGPRPVRACRAPPRPQ